MEVIAARFVRWSSDWASRSFARVEEYGGGDVWSAVVLIEK
jgi:hypothetical protein